VVIYVENPTKTERPLFVGTPDISEEAAQGLDDVIDYAMAKNKTVVDEGKETMRYFVSGINCTPGSARSEMMAVKLKYEKDGGIVAFHGYQSFAPGEVSPEIAHEIGVKLATRLWGDRFQIVVATHLDKGHIHNHVVCNSVSHIDGKRFRSNKTTYRAMRKASDELCLEYGLSVIDNPAPGRAKHYAEWRSEREGKPTWKSIIKHDVDEAIKKAMTERQFFSNLKALGYEIKQGLDISVRPAGKERYFRLARNFGDAYTIENIRRRILGQTTMKLPIPKHRPPDRPRPAKMPAVFRGSIYSLHRHYLYLFGFYEKGSPGANERMHFLLREDLRRLDEISADEKLLGQEGINTAGQLSGFKDNLKTEIAVLANERKQIRYEIRAMSDGDTPKTTKDDPRIKQINNRLKKLRKEVRQCERIAVRSGVLQKRIEQIEQDEYKDESRREVKQSGRIRTGNRNHHEDGDARR
jgi:hypothetical protein